MEITTRQLIEWKFEGAFTQKAYEGDLIYYKSQQKNVKLMGYGKNGNNISHQGFLEVQDLETSAIDSYSATHFLAKRPIDAEGTTTTTTPTNQTAATKTTTNRSSVKKSEEPLWATVVETAAPLVTARGRKELRKDIHTDAGFVKIITEHKNMSNKVHKVVRQCEMLAALEAAAATNVPSEAIATLRVYKSLPTVFKKKESTWYRIPSKNFGKRSKKPKV